MIFLPKKGIQLLPNCLEGKEICIIYSKALLRDDVFVFLLIRDVKFKYVFILHNKNSIAVFVCNCDYIILSNELLSILINLNE